MTDEGERARLEERLRAAGEQVARAQAEAAAARRELAELAAPRAPEGGPDFGPALRLLRPVIALEAVALLVMTTLAWHHLMHEDVPPPALTLALLLVGGFVWPGFILRELGRGTWAGWYLLIARAVGSAALWVAVMAQIIDRGARHPIDAAVGVALVAVESVFLIAAWRAWPQRARIPTPVTFVDLRGEPVGGRTALRVAAVLGVLGTFCLGVVGANLDGRTPGVGVVAVLVELAWGVLPPLWLAAGLARSGVAASPWLNLRAVGAAVVILALLGTSPYALLFAIFSKDLLPVVVAGWPAVLGVEIAVLVAAIANGRARRLRTQAS